MPKLGMQPIRRQQLIVAAVAAIHERGLNGVTMGDIAKRAGVSPALAHHYFGSKDELLAATMRHLLGEFALAARHRLADAAGPRARVDAILEASFAPEQFSPALIARLLAIYLKRLEANLRHDLRPLVGEGAVALARGIAAMIDGLWLHAALPTLHRSPDEALGILRDYVDGRLAAAARH
ncbi:MAG: betI 2 [Proteobacteria bacterium]|nr:betI 2 [Pseudomonadota bacterium]